MSLIDGFDPKVIIDKALSKGGDFADLYIEDTLTSSITAEEGRVEKVLGGRDRGAGLRIIKDFKTYYAYTNVITSGGLLSLADKLSTAVSSKPGGVSFSMSGLESAPKYDIDHLPFDVSLEDKAALVKRASDKAWSFSDKIKQVKIIYGDNCKKFAVINSLGEFVEEETPYILFLAQVVAAQGDVIQTGYEPIGGIEGLELIESVTPEKVADLACERAIMMLEARKAPAGKMPVILSSEAGGTMIHEAVGHGLEADLANEGLSVYAGKVGELVASPLITVIDDGHVDKKRGTAYFDGEGTRTKRNVLIENGVLKGYMYDRLSAMKENAIEGKDGKALSTGNGRRESYKKRPIVRMTNTIIAEGKDNPADVLNSIQDGLLVKKMGGGQVNTVNGDFVFEVTEGYMIENGKVTDPVRGATLTGNGPTILKEIDMVGTDLGFGIGTCGKDGQGVPVSDAQPTLRIPEITVGGSL